MSKGRSEVEELALQFYRDHKKAVDLIRARPTKSGFDLALRRLFGDNPKPGASYRLGNRELSCVNVSDNRVSFMPTGWRDEFDVTNGDWPGCENWWAGYPLISYVDIRAGDDGRSGRLILKAEVGPISVHAVRAAVIDVIKTAAAEANLRRIQFPVDAAREGQLYSLFLQRNFVVVTDIRNAGDVENKLRELIAGFEPELDLVTRVIPRFPSGPGRCR